MVKNWPKFRKVSILDCSDEVRDSENSRRRRALRAIKLLQLSVDLDPDCDSGSPGEDIIADAKNWPSYAVVGRRSRKFLDQTKLAAYADELGRTPARLQIPSLGDVCRGRNAHRRT